MGMDTRAECDFKSTQMDPVGRWYGECRDGVASGRGYGIIVTADGASLEYLGEAEAGLADGIGGMLIRRRGAKTATYLEGGFSAGLADGVLRVEEAGESARWREYRAGNDVGRADSNRWAGLDFSPADAAGALP